MVFSLFMSRFQTLRGFGYRIIHPRGVCSFLNSLSTLHYWFYCLQCSSTKYLFDVVDTIFFVSSVFSPIFLNAFLIAFLTRLGLEQQLHACVLFVVIVTKLATAAVSWRIRLPINESNKATPLTSAILLCCVSGYSVFRLFSPVYTTKRAKTNNVWNVSNWENEFQTSFS